MKDGRTNTGNFKKTLNYGRRCECKLKESKAYSTDNAFIQHKHDKNSLQTKDQKPADKEIIEMHVKLHSDRRQIRGARDSITISFG